MHLLGLVLVGVGIYILYAVVYKWEWLMNDFRVKFLSIILRRAGAKVFYICLGIGLAIFGLLLAVG